MDELLKRVNRYTRQCLTERTDPDFADAVEEMKNTLMAFGANAYRYASIALEHEIEIGKLKSELEDGKPKWIPVSESLPETDKCVLVISYGRVCYARLLKSENNGSHPEFILQDGLSNMLRQPVIETTAHNKFTRNRITHWMPLPEPPKEETDG